MNKTTTIIIVLLVIPAVLAEVNVTDLNSTQETIISYLQTSTQQQSEQIISALNNKTFQTNITINQSFTDTQIEDLSMRIKNKLNVSFDPYINETGQIRIQKSFEDGISNVMDNKFRDQQDYFKNTLLPSQEKIELAEKDLKDCQTDYKILQSEYATAQIASNATIYATELEVKNAEQQTKTVLWIAGFLSLSIILVIGLPWWHRFREGGA